MPSHRIPINGLIPINGSHAYVASPKPFVYNHAYVASPKPFVYNHAYVASPKPFVYNTSRPAKSLSDL